MNAGLLEFLGAMKHSPVSNYGGVPGLTSWLIGAPGPRGLVRLMESSRDHQEPVIPHSHRFDFRCVVLAGRVRNIIWLASKQGDLYRTSTLQYGGAPGEYRKLPGESSNWATVTRTYDVGNEYAMRAEEVHSIFFARGTSVLFFEGPQTSDSSIILEPIVDGEVVPTFRVEPWAFKRPAGGAQ
jgi:hypothetical protein